MPILVISTHLLLITVRYCLAAAAAAVAPSSIPSNNITINNKSVVLVNTGNWTVDLTHDIVGGIIRVSGDGPKPPGVEANPVLEIGTANPITQEIIQSHPNYGYLSPLSECGIQQNLGGSNAKDYDLEEEFDALDIAKSGLVEPLADIKNEIRRKRIVGGKQVDPPESQPWMVQLYLLNIATGEHYFHCAGTLISNSTILTASHCLTRIQPGTTLDVAVVGNNDRRKIKFCSTSDPLENCSRSYTRAVEDVEVHDGYSEGNLNHDIGLIYLKTPVKIGPNVRPICLPYSQKLLENWKNIKMLALGWGSTNKFAEGYNSDLLKQVDLDLQTRSLCDKFHIRVYGRTKEDRICTGGNTGRGTCNGDSGGGIVKKIQVPELGGEERVFQWGIVSAGGHVTDTCGFQGRPTIDTNVLYYLTWILNHIAPGVSSYTYTKDTGSWVETKMKNMKLESIIEEDELIVVNASEFKNEFSTGRKVDVLKHPNVHLLPSFDKCGYLMDALKNYDTFENVEVIKRLKRVVGGVPTNLDNYLPWMAQVYVRNVETNEIALRCSGTIITSRVILTASHCVTEILPPFAFDGVVVGQYNRNSTKECFSDACYFAVRVKISDLVVHSEYEKYTHKHNIALIRLAEDLKFTRMVQPICLPRREVLTDGIKVNRFFTAGWGRILRETSGADAKISEILLQIYVDLLPRRDCDFVYSRAVDILDRSRLCGGGKAARGECTGDGGSPLMKMIETNPTHVLNRRVFQLGIVSFTDCGLEGMPTVYTNVIYYLGWILDNLNPDDKK